MIKNLNIKLLVIVFLLFFLLLWRKESEDRNVRKYVRWLFTNNDIDKIFS